jgi:dienelactone hydrolase
MNNRDRGDELGSRTRQPRLRRVLLSVASLLGILLAAREGAGSEPPAAIAASFRPPAKLVDDLGPYRSVLTFDDGRKVTTPEEWRLRRVEILNSWHSLMGQWPPLIDPKLTEIASEPRDGFTQKTVKLTVSPERTVEGYLLVPEGKGPFPAMLVVYYEPETAIGKGQPLRDFSYQLVKRGYVTLAIGFDPRPIEPGKNATANQPLTYLAYAAANCHTALASQPMVDPARIGVMGHSYGGKWAMFAACLHEKFACGVWSDPGVAFDDARSNVNYWEPWYLGWEPGVKRTPGLPTEANPAHGSYPKLVAGKHDLHELQALMAPRPFLVSGGSEDTPERWKALNHAVAVNRLLGRTNRVAMTNRPDHTPTRESNEQIYQFLDYVLKPSGMSR